MVCGDTRLSQAAVAGQASLRGCHTARATGAGVRGRVRRGESVRVRVSTNLRSKMAAACDLVTRGASDQ